MRANTRFTVAIHTLTVLAQGHAEPVTSEYIAGSVNTNPVVIRRVLGALRRARLVESQGGNGGGWRLVANPTAISLADVYRAVDGEPIFPLHHRTPNPNCPVGKHIQGALIERFAAANTAMEAELARTSLEDVVRDVRGLAGNLFSYLMAQLSRLHIHTSELQLRRPSANQSTETDIWSMK